MDTRSTQNIEKASEPENNLGYFAAKKKRIEKVLNSATELIGELVSETFGWGLMALLFCVPLIALKSFWFDLGRGWLKATTFSMFLEALSVFLMLGVGMAAVIWSVALLYALFTNKD